uniref:Uncharacterized protein n=1 Tax=Rhizophora mucronata TaxID=61149 RepID=A0A2P2QXG9_RHIMU
MAPPVTCQLGPRPSLCLGQFIGGGVTGFQFIALERVHQAKEEESWCRLHMISEKLYRNSFKRMGARHDSHVLCPRDDTPFSFSLLPIER